MNEFGTRLKQAREGRGVSLRQIAASTKISIVALEALERGDFSRLPGGIFSRAFVRAYADEVGLDPEEAVREYTELSEAAAANSERESLTTEISDDDRAFLERQRKAGKWLQAVAVIVVVALGGAIGYLRLSVIRKRTPSVQVVTDAPGAPVMPVSAPTPVPAAPSTQASASLEAVPTTVSVQLHATASSWVQVTTDGKLVLSRNLTIGETQTFQADKELTLHVGNAGAIEWTVNGRPARPLGTSGDVKRVSLTPETAAQFVK